MQSGGIAKICQAKARSSGRSKGTELQRMATAKQCQSVQRDGNAYHLKAQQRHIVAEFSIGMARQSVGEEIYSNGEVKPP